MIAQLHIEGGSSAQGWGDETGKGGFAGLLFNYSLAYGQIAGEHRELPCRWLDIRNSGVQGNFLPSIADSFRQHVLEARGLLLARQRQTLKSIAVFAIGQYGQRGLGYHGKEKYQIVWRDAFEQLDAICSDYNITPIVLGMPRLAEDTVFVNGQKPDHDLLQRLWTITAETTSAWDWDASMTFEDIVGNDKPNCMAPDAMHPNARGHTKVARYLIGRINEMLDIPDGLVPLPETEGPNVRNLAASQ